MDMRDVILSQAEQISRSVEVNKDIKIEGDFDSIVLCGMGGSGHPGDLINALGVSNVPLFVHRNYDLPLKYLGNMGFKKTLLVASSYSGNTEESLTAYEVAMKNKMPILASAAGGTLEEWAKRDGVPFVRNDFTGMQPRHTLFAAFTGIYTALNNSGLVRDITEDLQRVETILEQVTPDLEESGKQLAKQLKGKVVVYTATDSLGFAAKNFKIQTNENSKAPAFWNQFPELNHNEMVGFSGTLKTDDSPGKFHVVILHAEDDHPRNKARMDVTAEMYKKWGVTVSHFDIPGSNRLEQIFYATTLGMWTTYYLALEYGIDPVPVVGVEDFKNKLKELSGSLT
ncbi:hypothetical protein CL628_03395 [bacterium]|nr:hypothetical protein [bacterium]